MSEHAPEGLYVYQPFGPVSHPDRAETGRLFGVGGLPYQAKVDGLTREEAEAIVKALSPKAAREVTSPPAPEYLTPVQAVAIMIRDHMKHAENYVRPDSGVVRFCILPVHLNMLLTAVESAPAPPAGETARERIAELVNTLEKAIRCAYTGSAKHGSFLRHGHGEFVPSVFMVLDELRSALRLREGE